METPLLQLDADCRAHGFNLPEPALRGLEAYLDLLLKWNRAMNLVGHSSRAAVLEDLILDSFHLAEFVRTLPLPENPECWDFGAGAGLPGLPLRLVWQCGTYWLVEAREKRALFLQSALAACALPQTRVWHGRVENFMAEPARRAADLLISRAFMPWPQLLRLLEGRLSRENGGGLVLCLTLEEQPGNLPADLRAAWKLLETRAYSPSARHPKKRRYFWVFQQQ